MPSHPPVSWTISHLGTPPTPAALSPLSTESLERACEDTHHFLFLPYFTFHKSIPLQLEECLEPHQGLDTPGKLLGFASCQPRLPSLTLALVCFWRAFCAVHVSTACQASALSPACCVLSRPLCGCCLLLRQVSDHLSPPQRDFPGVLRAVEASQPTYHGL